MKKQEPSVAAKAAARCRKALKNAYPEQKFSVRVTRQAPRYRIQIEWIDGPQRREVLATCAGMAYTGGIETERGARLETLAELLETYKRSFGTTQWLPNFHQLAERHTYTSVPPEGLPETARGRAAVELARALLHAPEERALEKSPLRIARALLTAVTPVKDETLVTLEVYVALLRDQEKHANAGGILLGVKNAGKLLEMARTLAEED